MAQPRGPIDLLALKDRAPIPGAWFAKRGEDKMSRMLKRDKSRFFIIDPHPELKIRYFTSADVTGAPCGEHKGDIDLRSIMDISVEPTFGQEITITTSSFSDSASKPRDWILMSPDKLQAKHWVETIQKLINNNGEETSDDLSPPTDEALDRGPTSTNSTGGIEVEASGGYLDPDDAISSDEEEEIRQPEAGYLDVGSLKVTDSSDPLFGNDPGYLDVCDVRGTSSVEVKQFTFFASESGDELGVEFSGGAGEALRLHVGRVAPGGLASEEGLVVGDAIMLLCGKPVSGLSSSGAQEVLRCSKGEITMTVKHGASEEDMKQH